MASTPRRPESRHGQASEPLALEVALVRPAKADQEAAANAVRLLAAWAVRAAQARQAQHVSLDSSRPASDECTPIQAQEGA